MDQTQCIAAEAYVRDCGMNIARIFHFIFGTIILIMSIRIVWSYNTKSLKLHKNLIVSFKYSINGLCIIMFLG